MMYSELHDNHCPFAIKAQNLTCYFGKVKALAGMNLSVTPGSVCGLIGNNGAGKTTALHALMGFVPAVEGKMSVLGFNPAGQSLDIRQRVGFFCDTDSFYDWMSVDTLFQVGMNAYPNWDKDRCRELCGRFDLDTSKKIKHLSKGMMAKTKLVWALAHRPRCLLLDEPISGLDPTSRSELLAIIRDLSQSQHITTLITSHSLYELADIITDVCIIHQGHTLFSANMKQIKNEMTLLEMHLPEGGAPEALKDLIIQTRIGGSIRQFLIRDKQQPAFGEFIRQSDSTHVKTKDITLPEIFLFLTKDELI